MLFLPVVLLDDGRYLLMTILTLLCLLLIQLYAKRSRTATDPMLLLQLQAVAAKPASFLDLVDEKKKKRKKKSSMAAYIASYEGCRIFITNQPRQGDAVSV